MRYPWSSAQALRVSEPLVDSPGESGHSTYRPAPIGGEVEMSVESMVCITEDSLLRRLLRPTVR
jgi:hypothetical protein